MFKVSVRTPPCTIKADPSTIGSPDTRWPLDMHAACVNYGRCPTPVVLMAPWSSLCHLPAVSSSNSSLSAATNVSQHVSRHLCYL